MNGNSEKFILLDSDVVIHFSKAGMVSLLKQLFPNRLLILDVVVKELMKKQSFRHEMENILKFRIAREIPLPITNKDILLEYAKLKSRYGDGESACMAFCRYSDDILASSNVKDIKAYCEEHSITYITTMDILLEAFKKKTISEADCNEFINQVKSRGSKLPVDTIDEFVIMKGK